MIPLVLFCFTRDEGRSEIDRSGMYAFLLGSAKLASHQILRSSCVCSSCASKPYNITNLHESSSWGKGNADIPFYTPISAEIQEIPTLVRSDLHALLHPRLSRWRETKKITDSQRYAQVIPKPPPHPPTPSSSPSPTPRLHPPDSRPATASAPPPAPPPSRNTQSAPR